MVREQNVIPLMEVVSKMSYLPAKFIEDTAPGMRKRGRMQTGMVADITIFNPDTVTDNSDYPVGKGLFPPRAFPM